MDRHAIWRRVQHDVQQANERALSGHEAYVLAYVAGRPEPIELGHVETRRGEDEVWIRFESATAETSEGVEWIPPACRWVHVPESALLCVEVAYRKKEAGRRIGFTFDEVEQTDGDLAIY